MEVGYLGQEQLEEAEDHGPPGQGTGAVPVSPGSAHRRVHRIVAGAAVHGLQALPSRGCVCDCEADQD